MLVSPLTGLLLRSTIGTCTNNGSGREGPGGRNAAEEKRKMIGIRKRIKMKLVEEMEEELWKIKKMEEPNQRGRMMEEKVGKRMEEVKRRKMNEAGRMTEEENSGRGRRMTEAEKEKWERRRNAETLDSARKSPFHLLSSALFFLILHLFPSASASAQCPQLQAPCRCAPSVYEPVAILCENAGSLQDALHAALPAKQYPVGFSKIRFVLLRTPILDLA